MKLCKGKPRVVLICGPTGSGKTGTAILLAEAFQGRIVNADSMQVYRHMDIGTAKPTSDEQRRIKHYLLDIVEPDEDFNAPRFAEMATGVVFRLRQRKIVPFVVGGTGLYIKALEHGIFRAPSADGKVRGRLKARAAAGGVRDLYEQLSRCDPAAAHRIHPNDTYRIIRALEVYEVTGQTISAYHDQHRFGEQPFEVLKIGLNIPREVLYARINRRADAMIETGLLDEVQSLLQRGYDLRYKSMQSIGYRHMVDFIEKRLSWEEALETMKRDTRRYAKRQMTWFGRDPGIHWVEAKNNLRLRELIDRFLQARI